MASSLVGLVCVVAAIAGALWLIHHPDLFNQHHAVPVSEPRSHVHVLREWDER